MLRTAHVGGSPGAPDDGNPAVVRVEEYGLGAEAQAPWHLLLAAPVPGDALWPMAHRHPVLHVVLPLLQQQQREALGRLARRKHAEGTGCRRLRSERRLAQAFTRGRPAGVRFVQGPPSRRAAAPCSACYSGSPLRARCAIVRAFAGPSRAPTLSFPGDRQSASRKGGLGFRVETLKILNPKPSRFLVTDRVRPAKEAGRWWQTGVCHKHQPERRTVPNVCPPCITAGPCEPLGFPAWPDRPGAALAAAAGQLGTVARCAASGAARCLVFLNL
jgi:hypothetical protein